MASELIRQRLREVPPRPGCYLMRDRRGVIIYVGKAKNLRRRVGSYFRPGARHSPKVRSMVETVYDFEFITVRNEAGALAKILNIIGSHGFNMSSLHSRPVAGPLWNHYFFAELEGSVDTENGSDLLRQLRTVCDRLKMVGSYNSLPL